MLTELLTPENIIALLTLTSLEIVLGIDNIVFIAILAGKLPENQREKARKLGIMLAMFLRIGLLFSIGWVMSLTEPLFSLAGTDFSGKSLILLFGGLFLIYKYRLYKNSLKTMAIVPFLIYPGASVFTNLRYTTNVFDHILEPLPSIEAEKERLEVINFCLLGDYSLNTQALIAEVDLCKAPSDYIYSTLI